MNISLWTGYGCYGRPLKLMASAQSPTSPFASAQGPSPAGSHCLVGGLVWSCLAWVELHSSRTSSNSPLTGRQWETSWTNGPIDQWCSSVLSWTNSPTPQAPHRAGTSLQQAPLLSCSPLQLLASPKSSLDSVRHWWRCPLPPAPGVSPLATTMSRTTLELLKRNRQREGQTILYKCQKMWQSSKPVTFLFMNVYNCICVYICMYVCMYIYIYILLSYKQTSK